MASNEDDLQASKTEGYKIGEKKTVEEYAKLGRRRFHLCLLSTQTSTLLLVKCSPIHVMTSMPFTLIFVRVYISGI